MYVVWGKSLKNGNFRGTKKKKKKTEFYPDDHVFS